MAKEVSKTQIDRLGDRLKKGNITEDDLRLLDQYRRSFTEAYEIVVGDIRNKLGLEPTGRPAKSTTSISEKLRRESIRLTQIQDIAGCRLTVAGIANQDLVVQSLRQLFDPVTINDRRQQPSHGYRAVHVIVSCCSKVIEVQVRTELQHIWAELSEKLSDVINPAIKYGGGDEAIKKFLADTSKFVANEELIETELAVLIQSPQESLSDEVKQQIVEIRSSHSSRKQEIFKLLQGYIDDLQS
jgi:putative GTP pyrophosphokinase